MSVDERIARGQGAGGFLCPPGHPTRTMSVETDIRRRPENRGSMSLEYAAECKYIDPAVRRKARRILAEWKPAPITAREIRLWIRRALAHFKNCYVGQDAYTGEPSWNADALHICGGFQGAPRDEGKRRLFLDLCEDYGIKERAFWPRCFQEHDAGEHAGVRMIRKYYPEYIPAADEFASPDCADCGHHLNAHDNGDGGLCTVIVDMALYERSKANGPASVGIRQSDALCKCPQFIIRKESLID